MTRLRSALLLPWALTGLLAASTSAQVTWFVDVNGTPPGTGTSGDPFTSIQGAIDSPFVVPGDDLQIAAGTYVENVTLDKSLSVFAAAGAVVDAAQQGPALIVSQDAMLQGLTLRNGLSGADGGGLQVLGAQVVVSQMVIEDCTAQRGGAVFVQAGGQLDALNCEFRDCGAQGDGGGLFLEGATLNMQGGQVASNFSTGSGGGLHSAGSTLLLFDVTFQQNRAGFELGQPCPGNSSGGGLFSSCDSNATLDGCTLTGNTACSTGGGLSGQALVRDSVIEGNRAVNGGGLSSNFGCSLVIEDSLLRFNSANLEGNATGGGVDGPASLLRCQVLQNSVTGDGGGVHGADLEDCLIQGNTTFELPGLSNNGGGLANCTAVDCSLIGNEAVAGFSVPTQGGGAYLCDLSECWVEGNTAVNGGGASGGTLIGCMLLGNEASLFGGGAYFSDLEGCVLFQNHAEFGGGGSACDLVRCTVAGNQALFEGGGLYGEESPGGSARSSIVWSNAPSQIEQVPQVTYTDVEGGYPGTGNIDQDPSFWLPVSGDVHLLAGSSCIDAGDPADPLDSDGSRADMGAFPFDGTYVAAPRNYCEGNLNSNGCRARLAATGTPSLTGPDDFLLSVDQGVPGQAGIFIWSMEPNEVPFQGATLCLSAPIIRSVPVFQTGTGACGGQASFLLTQALLQASVGSVPFETVYAQFWFRDPGNSPFAVGLSDALEFALLP